MKENSDILSLADTIEPNTLWDLKKITRLCESSRSSEAAAKKSAERLVSADPILPTYILKDEICDEFGRGPKQIVLKALLENYKKTKSKLVFLQSIEVCNGFSGVMANDSRKERKWIWFKSNDSDQSIVDSLSQLIESYSENTFFLPSGSLVSLVRKLKYSKNDYASFFSKFVLSVYHTSLDEIEYAKPTGLTLKAQSSQTHLDYLESEAIHIMREVMAEAKNPVMLYSIGKDSSVMLHLAKKAFYPGAIPFPLLHVDTLWKFQEMYDFREYVKEAYGVDLLVYSNPEGIEKNISPFTDGSAVHTDVMKTQALKQALDKYEFDVAFGGARRDEEKSRAKERVFSFRNKHHHWDAKNQRPELWSLYNNKKNPGESLRVFPISNWTENDIWLYILREKIPIVPLYVSKERPVVFKNGAWILVDDDRIDISDNEKIEFKKVRFRTLGCYPLTGAVLSNSSTIEEVVLDTLYAKTSERQGRVIDNDEGASMEKKKQEGYF